MMRKVMDKINKFYVCNMLLVAAVICSVVFMFSVQFKVENLQDRIVDAQSDILAYEDQMKILEVEWVYLTRPERLRQLAEVYLKGNDYTLASQIKDVDKLSKYYLVNYRKSQSELALVR